MKTVAAELTPLTESSPLFLFQPREYVYNQHSQQIHRRRIKQIGINAAEVSDCALAIVQLARDQLLVNL